MIVSSIILQRTDDESFKLQHQEPRGRQRAILAYEISWFLFDFPVVSLKNDVILCKSGWGLTVKIRVPNPDGCTYFQKSNMPAKHALQNGSQS